MAGIALARSSRLVAARSNLTWLFPSLLLRRIFIFMSESTKKPDFHSRWNAFVDAYFHAVDLAPACRRHLFIPRDLDALWADFLRTQMDFAEAKETILADPDRFRPQPKQVTQSTGALDDKR